MEHQWVKIFFFKSLWNFFESNNYKTTFFFFFLKVPNRIFVGGISAQTTESELAQLFSSFGTVKGTKIIFDRAGVSKGYGFVTFETEMEARRIMREAQSVMFKQRKLNIAPAIKKQVRFH